MGFSPNGNILKKCIIAFVLCDLIRFEHFNRTIVIKIEKKLDLGIAFFQYSIFPNSKIYCITNMSTSNGDYN
jgi:hypothetical protein